MEHLDFCLETSRTFRSILKSFGTFLYILEYFRTSWNIISGIIFNFRQFNFAKPSESLQTKEPTNVYKSHIQIINHVPSFAL